MFTIKIGFEQAELKEVTFEKITKGQTILEICLKHNIDLRHNCGGVCACSTCHIYVVSGNIHLEEASIREGHFLSAAKDPQPNSRLACQCLLVSDEGIVEVIVPDQNG
jgi:ferredoxin, 2Fe-2S